MENTPGKFESWAIVELFGHQQIAGLLTEATIGGCALVRVDVPAVNGYPAFTKFYGSGAIYSITPCGESEALVAIDHIRPRAVSPYLVPDRPALPGPRSGNDGNPYGPGDDEDSDIQDDENDSDDIRF
jgi:hypothetical protein